MQLFYSRRIEGSFAYLEDAELQHCVKTLRKRVGDELNLMDGKGAYLRCRLLEIAKKEAKFQILSREAAPLPWSMQLQLAVAPTKNIDRTEWLLEKAVELGLNHFSPILCRYSERKKIRVDRLEKIALSAAKQSHKSYLTKVDELTNFADFLKNTTTINQRFIAHCYKSELPLLNDCFEYQPEGSALVLIGPEGDFSEAEVEMALQAGFQEISLGKSRLRTETAALAACHIMQLAQQ